MKKLLYIFSALFLALPVIAQQSAIMQHAPAKHPHAIPQTLHQQLPTTAIIPIFTEDFASGLPAGWTITDNAGAGETWTYTTVGTNAGATLSPLNTSAGNGYMMFDSDNGGPTSPAENCDLTTPAINCTGQSQVYLSFYELYTEFQHDSAYVSVSNDGVTWSTIYCPDIFLAENASTQNPHLITMNISSVAANMPTVFVRFHYQGDDDYWWLLDDIKVYVPSATEIAAIVINPLSTDYTRLPLSQAASIQIRGIVKNLGGATIFGATAVFEVIDTVSNAVVFTSSVNVSPIAPLQGMGMVSATNFTPPGIGYYRTRLRVTASGDVDTVNNSLTSFLVTNVNDSVFARDNGSSAGELGIGGGPLQGIIGQNFFMTGTDDLTSVSIFLTDAMNPNPAGSPVYVTIHDQVTATAPTAAVASTDTLLITPGLIPPGGAWFTLPVSGGPFTLTSGWHFFGVHEADSTLSLSITESIFTSGSVWTTWTGIPSPPAVNNWALMEDFGYDVTYQLRANYGSLLSTAVPENATAPFEIYPNPSADQVTVSFAQNAEREIEILDATGRSVSMQHNSNAIISLDLSGVEDGIYFIRVTENNKTSVRRISILK
jgi:hypothetical protein